jgi:hypothetical protein
VDVLNVSTQLGLSRTERLFGAFRALVPRCRVAGMLVVIASAFGLLLAFQCAASAGDHAADEYHLKALFLFNFVKFVDWPSDALANAICIGVIGDPRYADALDQTVAGRVLNGRGFVVKRFKSEAEARDCQIVFVTASEKKRTRSILDALRGSAVLTVGEAPGFAEAGGILNFEIIDSKLRFEANLEAADRARLKISSKLLSLARIVREKSD